MPKIGRSNVEYDELNGLIAESQILAVSSRFGRKSLSVHTQVGGTPQVAYVIKYKYGSENENG